MEKTEIIAILQALADGVHPTTGEVFSSNSPYNDVVIVRTLFHAIKLIEQPNIKNKKLMSLRSGAGWDEKEDAQLLEAFNKEHSIQDISEVHRRTKGAIRSRLTKLGVLEV